MADVRAIDLEGDAVIEPIPSEADYMMGDDENFDDADYDEIEEDEDDEDA